MDALTKRMLELRTTGSMDEDNGGKFYVEDGEFVLQFRAKVSATDKIMQALKVVGVPPHATIEEEVDGDWKSFVCRWPSVADELFQPGGTISQALEGYEMRPQQLKMARMVQGAMEMRQNVIGEAPTGTGKSLAYGAPAIVSGKRVIISTSNKALQAQLYHKDIPFLVSLLRPEAKVVLAQGKSNYLCKFKLDEAMTDGVDLSTELVDWAFAEDCTGNLEDAKFGISDEERQAVNVDSSCLKRKCPLIDACHYYKERAKREEADVLIINHALLVVNELYPMANLLPPCDLLVIDEAHQLTAYTRSALGEDFTFGSARKSITQVARRHGIEPQDELAALEGFVNGFRTLVGAGTMDTLPLEEWENEAYSVVGPALSRMAQRIWPDDEEPQSRQDAQAANDAKRIRNLRDRLRRSARHIEGDIRWLDLAKPGVVDDETRVNVVPHDVSWLISQIAGFSEDTGGLEVHGPERCASCGHEHSPIVYVLEGNGLCSNCVAQVDYEGVAEPTAKHVWLEAWSRFQDDHKEHSQRPPVIFCSATLAAPNFATVKREWGVKYALEFIVDSPFDYKNQAAFYAPNGDSPSPRDRKIDKAEYEAWLESEIRQLVKWSGGGAFVLFTSNYMMGKMSDAMRWDFEGAGMQTFVQGELPKVEMVRRFTEAENGVLFGTRSFFEGVDVKGDALRLVILDKLPFEPLTPLRKAEDEHLKRWAEENVRGLTAKQIEFYPFSKITIPRMIVDLKQVFGRLIRTQTDTGVFALLDNAVRTKYYGRKDIIPALPKVDDLYEVSQVAYRFERWGQDGSEEVSTEPVTAKVAANFYGRGEWPTRNRAA